MNKNIITDLKEKKLLAEQLGYRVFKSWGENGRYYIKNPCMYLDEWEPKENES